MIVLGIDPGYGITGYGFVHTDGYALKPVEYGAINTPKEMSFVERLKVIEDSVLSLMARYSPDSVAVEELFFAHNKKTAIKVAESRGVILNAAYKKCANIFEYTPMEIKQALTGYGKADKRQIQCMVKNLLRLDAIPKPDDAADALAVAITHAQTARTASAFRVK